MDSCLEEKGIKYESKVFLFGRDGKGCSASVYECKVSHHSYLLWIHSLDSESARLFRLEGLTPHCCHEQKLPIMNSQLQVTRLQNSHTPTSNHVVKEMAFLNDVGRSREKLYFACGCSAQLGLKGINKCKTRL